MKKATFILSTVCVLASAITHAQSFSPVGAGNYSLTSSTIIINGGDIYADNMFVNGSDIFTYGKFSNGNWSKMGGWGSVVGVTSAAKIGDNIYVGGHFINAAGDTNMDKIARWNITTGTWHALGGGLNGYVMDIVQMGTDIIVAGSFTNAGGDPNADYIAKWNGTSWSALGSQVVSTNSFTVVSALAVHNNELYIGGNFYSSNGGVANYLTKWDGTSFQQVYGWNSQVGAVYEIVFDTDNNLYIGGEFPAKIAKYNGTGWDLMGNFTASGASWISDIEIVGTSVYVGGKFQDAKGLASADNIAKYNGTTWEAVGGGLNEEVYEMAVSGADLYIAGKFTDAGGNTAADKLVKYGVSGSTGLNNFFNTEGFKIYPNPNNGEFNIQTEKDGVFELMNITGQIINTYLITNTSQSINEKLSPGLYFIREKETNAVSKVIVQ
ncbi:MAG: T9SS type A sorting domain-containing protein [Bacteroidia bacterium]|nr:T9SS type A sorting domain-containing protein [Bacteroidia bacterium]